MLTRKSFSTNFAPRSKNHGSHCCLTRQPLCFACAVQLPTFCLHCILIHRQRANRNGETVKHFHNCIKVLSQFRIHTVQICGSIARGRSGAHDYAQIPNLQFSLPTFVPENCRPVTLQLSVAIAKFRKTCLSQIVLLQYKAKPYLRFQNLGCHYKILWCSFDTQKRLKKHCHWAQVIIQTHKQGCQVVMKNRATITIKARKYQKIQKKDKYTKTLPQSIHI